MAAAQSTEGASSWTFFTNHAHVLFFLASNPDARTRDIADAVHITERAAQRIVHELEEGGYIRIVKKGRRNSYVLNDKKKLRHPIEKHASVATLIGALGF
jgi:DNA-binding MarR family transcriptional regulator